MNPSDVQIVENNQKGFSARSCLGTQSRIYGQLRKRYLVDTLGQVMGPPSGAGLSPPPIQFMGVPVRGDLELAIQITTGGPTGTAIFSWWDSSTAAPNGNVTVIANLLTAPLVSLEGTGVSVAFPSSPAVFDVSNLYLSSTPVPEVILRWIADMTTPRIFERRGVHPTNDDAVKLMFEREATAAREVAESANSKDGLFDLPLNVDTAGSGITQGSPIACGQTSPYVWQDEQACIGRFEDSSSGTGTDG